MLKVVFAINAPRIVMTAKQPIFDANKFLKKYAKIA